MMTPPPQRDDVRIMHVARIELSRMEREELAKRAESIEQRLQKICERVREVEKTREQER